MLRGSGGPVEGELDQALVGGQLGGGQGLVFSVVDDVSVRGWESRCGQACNHSDGDEGLARTHEALAW